MGRQQADLDVCVGVFGGSIVCKCVPVPVDTGAAAFGETGLIVLGVPVADGGEAGAGLGDSKSLASLFGVDVVGARGTVVVAGVVLLRGKGAASGGGRKNREENEHVSI